MQIEYIKTEELIPYAGNPKKHSPEQVSMLASSIREFGFINPIIVDKNNEIVAGHGRLLAAKKLGIEKVPVLRAEHLTPAQVRAYRIADNKLTELGEWDTSLLRVELEELSRLDIDVSLTGFSDKEIEELLNDIEDLTDIDREKEDELVEPTDEKPPFTQPGDLWMLGEHKLLCGDSAKKEHIERLMQGEKADMVFTDPPYGVSYADKNEFLNQYDKGNRIQREIKNDHLPPDELENLLASAFANMKAAMANSSAYYITAPQGGSCCIGC